MLCPTEVACLNGDIRGDRCKEVHMIRTILLPVDGSTFSEHALPVARDAARGAGARLHIIHVHESPPPRMAPSAS